MISRDEFTRLAADNDVIPLVRETLADFDTPISVIARLRGKGRCFLLESVEGGETWGRYSVIGFNTSGELAIENDRCVLRRKGEETWFDGNPVDAMQNYLGSFRIPDLPDLPRFFGGAVGYFTFESVRFFERCGEVKATDGRFPDACLFLCDDLLVFDNLSHSIKMIHCVHPREFETMDAAYESGKAALTKSLEVLRDSPCIDMTPASERTVEIESNMDRAAYEAMVQRCRDYIRDGDVIQVVVAQHFSGDVTASPLDVYRALRYVNPSPYMYYLDFDDGRAIVGSSPEVMVRVTDRQAVIRPIAGTRPRGKDHAEDLAFEKELLADPKERAEHVMLVDLARNDLGRIAEVGSVEVREYMIIERYSHVMHIVSQVVGTVREDLDAFDVFKASFPAGTLSGAPKVRAMEIINEVEPQARGPYGGALGYITYGGQTMDVAITIRTVVMDGTKATVTAGAGIVFDSDPEKEYFETRHKSRGMRRALQMAENGLKLESDE